MKLFLIIMALLIVAPAPALAVRKIEKKTKQQSSTEKKVDQSQQPESKENKAQGDQPGEARNAPEIKQPQREDRFIDENSDGINDRIDQRQTVKVRKRESENRENRKVDTPKKEKSKEPEKKSRRDR